MTKHYGGMPVICGLRAANMQLTAYPREVIHVATFGDPLALPMSFGQERYELEATFLLTNDDHARANDLFPIGEGGFTARSLGPADVCQFCGTAWLPGTIACPSCGGTTDHFDSAIEYESSNAGRITEKHWRSDHYGLVVLEVRAEFSRFEWTSDPLHMFEFSLWRNAPALWVCRFCGHVVHGKTSDCPGCGGKRQPVREFATQRRVCLYCGTETVGGYACPRCNVRLMAPYKKAVQDV